MNEFEEWLDGVRRWFYGGEPGLDDLPPAVENASAVHEATRQDAPPLVVVVPPERLGAPDGR